MTAPADPQPFGALGVVRVQVAPDVYIAGLPRPVRDAGRYAADLATDIERAGDTTALVAFDTGSGLDCWIRARDVISIEVVPTEDPSA